MKIQLLEAILVKCNVNIQMTVRIATVLWLNMADPDTIVNSLLCFLNSAKSDFNNNVLEDVIYAFYSHDDIKQAKEIMGNIVSEDIIWRRKPEQKRKDLNDLITFHEKACETKRKMNYVTNTYKAMPPIGLTLFAPLITSLTNEVSRLNEVVPKIVDIKTEVYNTADTVRQMKLDLNQVKQKFSSAIMGLEDASKDITITANRVDIEDFRNSSLLEINTNKQTNNNVKTVNRPPTLSATGTSEIENGITAVYGGGSRPVTSPSRRLSGSMVLGSGVQNSLFQSSTAKITSAQGVTSS